MPAGVSRVPAGAAPIRGRHNINEGGSAMRRLNENQRWSLINALRMAADQSADYAAAQVRIATQLRAGHRVALFAEGDPGAKAAEALAAQFQRQRAEYGLLAYEVEAVEYIEFGDVEEDEDAEPDHHAMLTGAAEPCCYGFVTSGGQVHEPGCHRYGRD